MRKCLFCLYVERSASSIIVLNIPREEVFARGWVVDHEFWTLELLIRIRNLKIAILKTNINWDNSKHQFFFISHPYQFPHKSSSECRYSETLDLSLRELGDPRLVSASVPDRLIVMDLKIEWVVVVFDFLFDFHEKTYSSRGGWSLSSHPTGST